MMGAAQGQGTQRGPASPQYCGLTTAPPACLARRRAALEGALAGGGAPGRHPLICRFSDLRFTIYDLRLLKAIIVNRKSINRKSLVPPRDGEPPPRQLWRPSGHPQPMRCCSAILVVRTSLPRPDSISVQSSISSFVARSNDTFVVCPAFAPAEHSSE